MSAGATNGKAVGDLGTASALLTVGVPIAAPRIDGMVYVARVECAALRAHAHVLFDPPTMQLVLAAPCGCRTLLPLGDAVLGLFREMADGHGVREH